MCQCGLLYISSVTAIWREETTTKDDQAHTATPTPTPGLATFRSWTPSTSSDGCASLSSSALLMQVQTSAHKKPRQAGLFTARRDAGLFGLSRLNTPSAESRV